MKIIAAENIGFCSGVKRAILIAEKSLKESPKPVQFLGNLVHNEKVIEKFKKKGVRFIKNLKEAKPGTLIIQAHGFPPFPKKFNKKILIRDATCPLVKKVQTAANSFQKENYKVIIIGDKNHDEVTGINGFTGNKAVIIENGKQAKKLPKFNKIGAVAQTTQNLENVNRALKVLKKKSKKLKFINTLCPEVQTRQKELGLILKKTDGILVIGSKTSANTGRLTQLCKNFQKPFWRINSLEELKGCDFKNLSRLGMASGTSTPDWEIKKIKKWLQEKKLK